MLQKKDGLHKKIVGYISRITTINREFIGAETFEVKTIIYLLMRRRHDGKEWTKKRKQGSSGYILKNAVKIVYPFFISLLPGGLFLLPFVTYWLHRPKG